MPDVDRVELTSIAHALIEGASIDVDPAYLIWLCQFDADDLLTIAPDPITNLLTMLSIVDPKLRGLDGGWKKMA